MTCHQRITMSLKCVLILTLVFLSELLFAQTKEIDSLANALSCASERDSVEIFLDLAIEWIDVDKKKSLSYTKEAYKQSIELGDSVQIMKSLRFIGMVLKRLEKIDSAIHVMTSVIPFARRNKLNNELLFLYQSLGGIYLFMGHYDRSLKFYTE